MDDSIFRCVGCDDKFHYIDMQIINGQRMCLLCAHKLAEQQAAELATLRADLAEARADVQRFEAQLDAANRELAQARAERDEAVSKVREHAEHVNFYGNLLTQTEMARRKLDEQVEFYRGELAKAQVCADEMAALAWKWKYKAARQRDTTMALVVACRAMDCVGFVKMGQVRWYAAVRGEIKQAKKSGQQAGE